MRFTALAATMLLCLSACGKKQPVAAAVPNAPRSEPVSTPQQQTNRETTPARSNSPATISAPSTGGDRAIQDAIRGLNAALSDAFFDFDKFNLRPDAIKSLTENAGVLREAMTRDRSLVLTVEGHCDERGSAEYNTALGDKRATEAKQLLVQLGIPDGQVKTVSFGAERPVCTESSEDCWQKNRRAHVTYARAN